MEGYLEITENLKTVVGLTVDQRDERQSTVVARLNNILEELLERFETNLSNSLKEGSGKSLLDKKYACGPKVTVADFCVASLYFNIKDHETQYMPFFSMFASI